jgi:hypothetical protein
MDTKIMLHRATDFARDASIQQRKGDIEHAFIVKQTNENVQMQKTKVKETLRRKDNTIQKDREKQGQRDGGGKGKNGGTSKQGGSFGNQPPGESRIDIRI